MRTANRPCTTILSYVFALAALITPDVVTGQESGIPSALLAAEGRDLYRSACSSCHGRSGDGEGPAARYMKPRPRDFTTGSFKFRSTPSGALPTDEDLFRVISEGVPGTWMPAWNELLSERERWALVEYLKILVPDFQLGFGREAPLSLPAGAPPGVSAQEGKFVYLALQCSDCHGLSGRGDGPSAATLVDDWGRTIRPYDFTRGEYKNGGSPDDIYRTLRTGLSGTPMPAYEPEAVLYPGGSDLDLSKHAQALEPDDLAALRTYLADEPGSAALAGLTESERNALADRRLWSLVMYVESLYRAKSFWYRVFVESPNATQSSKTP